MKSMGLLLVVGRLTLSSLLAQNETAVPLLTDFSFKPEAVLSPASADVRLGGLLLQPDGKVLVSGRFIGSTVRTNAALIRLMGDGSVDPGFSALVANLGLANGFPGFTEPS